MKTVRLPLAAGVSINGLSKCTERAIIIIELKHPFLHLAIVAALGPVTVPKYPHIARELLFNLSHSTKHGV